MVSVTSMPARTLQTCRKPPRKVAQRPHNNDSRDSVATSPALSVLGYVRGGHHTSSAKQCRPSTDHYRSLQSRASHQPFIRTETTRWKSTPRQAERDILNGPTAQKWMRAYLGGFIPQSEEEYYIYPFTYQVSGGAGLRVLLCSLRLVIMKGCSIRSWTGFGSSGWNECKAVRFVVGKEETYTAPTVSPRSEGDLV